MNKMTIILIAAGVVIILGIASLFLNPFHAEMKKQSVSIGNTTFKVEVADTMMSRAKGLSGRDGLDAGKGMLFLFDSAGMQGFWMKDMKFPIDIIWINGDRVIGFAENLQPESKKTIFSLTVYYPPSAVDKVLEVNAGAVNASGFQAGDTVRYSQIDNK